MIVAFAREAASGAQKSSRIQLRTTKVQENLIKQGAAASQKSMTDFILDAATEAAVTALTEQRFFVLDDDAWARFTRALERPAEVKPRLKALFEEPSVLEK
jgi:uncharacterized protein (DUF1778 family)